MAPACICTLCMVKYWNINKRCINRVNCNSQDPDQAQRYVGPDRGTNCLHRLLKHSRLVLLLLHCINVYSFYCVFNASKITKLFCIVILLHCLIPHRESGDLERKD